MFLFVFLIDLSFVQGSISTRPCESWRKNYFSSPIHSCQEQPLKSHWKVSSRREIWTDNWGKIYSVSVENLLEVGRLLQGFWTSSLSSSLEWRWCNHACAHGPQNQHHSVAHGLRTDPGHFTHAFLMVMGCPVCVSFLPLSTSPLYNSPAHLAPHQKHCLPTPGIFFFFFFFPGFSNLTLVFYFRTGNFVFVIFVVVTYSLA